MQRAQRLRHRREFAATFETGHRFSRGMLAVRVRANPATPRPRFGFAMSRRMGTVVVRNRIRRRLREAARLSGATGQADVVVIARPEARAASYQELDRTLRALLRQAGLLGGEGRE